MGLSFPDPGTWAAKRAARIVWTGRDQALVMGADVPALEGAAVTDQSDGWAGFSLTGPGAEAALARLVAVDLRAAAFPVGGAARAGLNHMSMVLLRTAAEAFEIYVFRSMARTAWHELAEVLGGIDATQLIVTHDLPFALACCPRADRSLPPPPHPTSMTPNPSPRPRGPRLTGC